MEIVVIPTVYSSYILLRRVNFWCNCIDLHDSSYLLLGSVKVCCNCINLHDTLECYTIFGYETKQKDNIQGKISNNMQAIGQHCQCFLDAWIW